MKWKNFMENIVNFWLIAIPTHKGIWDDFIKNNKLSIDFSNYNISDLFKYNNYRELPAGDKQKKFIWQFAHKIKVGDIVIAKKGISKFYGIGKVIKSYYYESSKEKFNHSIGVEWLKIGEWNMGNNTNRHTVYWDRNSERINLYKSILNGTYRKNIEKVVMNKNINDYLDKLKKTKNLILRGAPGTGKTYLAKEVAKELTNGNEDQIDFVQFHPSYDYTDFVEGLRPVSNGDGAIEFRLQDGIFKDFCQKAKEAQLIGGQDNFDEAWDSYLEYINVAEEKEYITKTSYLSVNSRQNLSVNYDSGVPGWSLPSKYVYELYKDKNYNKQEYYKSGGKTVLETLRKRFGLKDYISPTEIDTDKKFVFIIDEINRGEISKIFGELFFSIDPGYRGEKGSVSTQYANLHETDEKFYIPENVYLIGTMNDIDRSVDTFDFAMRRRFRFVEVTAESQVGMLDKELNIHAEEAKLRLRNLNAAIENVQELNSHYHIGPSYFLKLKDVDFDYELLWSDYIKPLLEDYLRGSYEESETLATLKKAFDLTNKEQTVQQDTGDNDADN